MVTVQGASSTARSNPDYLIVGAGGGGLQTALLLKKQNKSFTIVEKESVVGSFWTKYPRFGELISVNKRVRNETQRMRYDWHSFLESPIKMMDVTEDYFPKALDLQRYMAKVVKAAGVDVEFGVEIDRIMNDNTPCVVLTDGTKRCAKYRVFMGTGMKEKEQPIYDAMLGSLTLP